jgi:hypothetical protein
MECSQVKPSPIFPIFPPKYTLYRYFARYNHFKVLMLILND